MFGDNTHSNNSILNTCTHNTHTAFWLVYYVLTEVGLRFVLLFSEQETKGIKFSKHLTEQPQLTQIKVKSFISKCVFYSMASINKSTLNIIGCAVGSAWGWSRPVGMGRKRSCKCLVWVMYMSYTNNWILYNASWIWWLEAWCIYFRQMYALIRNDW